MIKELNMKKYYLITYDDSDGIPQTAIWEDSISEWVIAGGQTILNHVELTEVEFNNMKEFYKT